MTYAHPTDKATATPAGHVQPTHPCSRRIALLGTGGTIAGLAASATDHTGYVAGQVGITQLLGSAGQDVLGEGWMCDAHDVAQMDSKDMSFVVWQRLLRHVLEQLANPAVAAVVITHGTDTLEETALFLLLTTHVARAAGKPIILTCAMRPASALSADGPQNLADALTVAQHWGLGDVLVVCAGAVHAAAHVQKVHGYRLDAFSSGDAGPLAYVEEGRVRRVGAFDESAWVSDALPAWQPVQAEHVLLTEGDARPEVDVWVSGAGVGARAMDLLLLARTAQDPRPAYGWVMAGTGNGTLPASWARSLNDAKRLGVAVWLSSRCAWGHAIPAHAQEFDIAVTLLPPVKARVALMLALLAQGTDSIPNRA